jgi:hypothetical protein
MNEQTPYTANAVQRLEAHVGVMNSVLAKQLHIATAQTPVTPIDEPCKCLFCRTKPSVHVPLPEDMRGA